MMRGLLVAALLPVMNLAAGVQQPALQARPGCEKPGTKRVIMVTGSTDGLGRAVALKLASSGAHIIVHGRNLERGDSVVNEIKREGKGSACFYQADLASLKEVRSLAEAILRDYQKLDVLVNNAGIGSRIPEVRTLSADGHELRFAVNYLSGFLLTRTLLPLMEKSAPARVAFVSSTAQSAIDFDDVMIEKNYTGIRAYGQSKLSQVMFAFDLAAELKDKNVLVNALHPATYMPTHMVLSGGFEPQATIEEGVQAVLNAVNTPNVGTGQYFNGTRIGRPNAQANDTTARAKLRELSMKLTGAR